MFSIILNVRSTSLLSLFLLCSFNLACATRIRLTGFLRDDLNQTISGGIVQIRQANENGTYTHESRPTPHQHFGTSVSRADGNFTFITIRPGKESGALLSTIDVKVNVSGTVLTTRLYFADESPSYPSSQILDLIPSSNDTVDVIAFKNLTINLNGGGSAFSTPSDPDALGEDFWLDSSEFDNNLVDIYITSVENFGSPSLLTMFFDLLERIFFSFWSRFVLFFALF